MSFRPVLRPGRLLAVAALTAALTVNFIGQRGDPVANRSGRYTLTSLGHEAPPHGAVSLAGVWHLDSPDERVGSYSALVARPNDSLRAYGDSGWWLSFRPPGAGAGIEARVGFNDYPADDPAIDVESATRDPATGTSWIGIEGTNELRRFDAQDRFTGSIRPPAMARFRVNGGAESVARLPDGRFLVLAEENSWRFPMRHVGLLFPRDPLLGDRPVEFAFRPPLGFDPTDTVALPDGRVLILLRAIAPSSRGLFASRILVADSRTIAPGEPWPWHLLADLNALAPPENYEGMTVLPGKEATTIWLISDANRAVRVQRTLLVKLIWKR